MVAPVCLQEFGANISASKYIKYIYAFANIYKNVLYGLKKDASDVAFVLSFFYFVFFSIFYFWENEEDRPSVIRVKRSLSCLAKLKKNQSWK